LHLLDNFLEAGGNDSNTETFRFPLRGIRAKLSSQLLEVAYMDPAAADALMAKERLTWRAICDVVVEEYNSMVGKGKWSPAMHARDAKAPPRAFGNLAATCSTDPELAAQAFMLLQQTLEASKKRDKSNDTCNSCGKKGHWSTECPDKNLGSSGRGRPGNVGNNSFQGRNNRNPQAQQSGGRRNNRPNY